MSDDKPAMPEPKQLSADDILAAKDLEILPVDVPEWNGSVNLRVLPADEGLALNEELQDLQKAKNQTDAIFLLLGACLVDAAGKRLFSTKESVQALKSRSIKVLLRLQKIALQLQGWGDEAPAKNG